MRLFLIVVTAVVLVMALAFYSFFNIFNNGNATFLKEKGEEQTLDNLPGFSEENVAQPDEEGADIPGFRGPSAPPGSGFIGPKADPPGY